MSRNHQFLELAEKVFKRYQKTTVGALSGNRPNPHDLKARLSFILSTPESQIVYKQDEAGYYVFDGRLPILYDEEVLETYSAEEDSIFRRLNEVLFSRGLLVEYTEERSTPTEEIEKNALTDAQVLEIAQVRSPIILKSKVKSITSATTLQRIREKLIGLGRPQSFVTEVDNRIKDL